MIKPGRLNINLESLCVVNYELTLYPLLYFLILFTFSVMNAYHFITRRWNYLGEKYPREEMAAALFTCFCSLNVIHRLSLFCLPAPPAALVRFIINLLLLTKRTKQTHLLLASASIILAVPSGSRRSDHELFSASERAA